MARAPDETLEDPLPKRSRVGPSVTAVAGRRLPPRVRERISSLDPVSVVLLVILLAAAAFYLWTAGTSFPLELGHHQVDPYNKLATALLHFSLSVGKPPAGLLHLLNPYDATENATFRVKDNIQDFALYHDRLYLTWGPAPVLVFLVPLHILGLEPSPSLTTAIFAILGLGFALGTLRVVIGQIGGVALWRCALAALVLTLASAVPFILRRPEVYEEAIAGGFCFLMAGVWITVSVLVDRRATLLRLVVMSACFGLAGASRPTLWFAALALVPVYRSLRGARPRAKLLMALVVPVGVCLLLVLAYNQARFGKPFEVGTKYALGGFSSYAVHFGALRYVAPGAWLYSLSPPRFTALFPFISLAPPPLSYPASLPAGYMEPEVTGGLLPMVPIVVFLGALPWIWRRRPSLLGALLAPLLALAGAGIAGVLFLSYEFFSTTERYEVDFSTLLVLGALAAWLALSEHLTGFWRWVTRIGGGALATWSCVTGLAISFTGYAALLEVNHAGTWAALEKVTSPIATAIVAIAGHPVLGEITGGNFQLSEELGYGSLGVNSVTGSLNVGNPANLTIVSPGRRSAALVAFMGAGADVGGALRFGAGASGLQVGGDGNASTTYPVPARRESVRIPVTLKRGLNVIDVKAIASGRGQLKPEIPAPQQLVYMEDLSLANAYR